jgi:hypothetical protein
MPPEGIIIQADDFIFRQETNLELGGHCFLVPYILPAELINELKNASIIQIDPWPHASEEWVRSPTAMTLNQHQRSVLQSFLVDTENL